MIRPKKKILFESKVLGKLPKDYEDIGFNECHDLDTKYIESLKLEAQKLWDEIVELKKDKKDLMSHLDSKSEVKKPSVEEIENIIDIWISFHNLGNYDKIPTIEIYDHLAKTLHLAIHDRLNKEE